MANLTRVRAHNRNIDVPKTPTIRKPEWEDFTTPTSYGTSGIRLQGPNGTYAEIVPDESPESPREWSNLGHMATFTRDYEIGDKSEIEKFKDDPQEAYQRLEKEGAEVLPVYLYDHSGLRLSTKDFGDQWDSGQVGFIYATKDDIKKEYGKVTKQTREKARERLRAEVKAMDQFVSGDVYTVLVKDKDGEVIDAVGGFYGSDYAKEEAVGMLKNANAPKGPNFPGQRKLPEFK